MSAADRHQYRALVADVAARAKEKLPVGVNGRVESAVKLVLGGDVQPQDDGTITVYSASDPTRRYVLQGTSCTCADYERGHAPQGWCQHRIAAGIDKRVRELAPHTEQPDNVGLKPALPEARCSINARLMWRDIEVQVTLRGEDEHAVMTRLEAIVKDKGLKPIPKPAPRGNGGWKRNTGYK